MINEHPSDFVIKLTSVPKLSGLPLNQNPKLERIPRKQKRCDGLINNAGRKYQKKMDAFTYGNLAHEFEMQAPTGKFADCNQLSKGFPSDHCMGRTLQSNYPSLGDSINEGKSRFVSIEPLDSKFHNTDV